MYREEATSPYATAKSDGASSTRSKPRSFRAIRARPSSTDPAPLDGDATGAERDEQGAEDESDRASSERGRHREQRYPDSDEHDSEEQHRSVVDHAASEAATSTRHG